MKPITTQVTVTQSFEITYDKDRFTTEFLLHFRKHFYEFTNVRQHIEHIAQCIARGLVHSPDLKEFGISWRKL